MTPPSKAKLAAQAQLADATARQGRGAGLAGRFDGRVPRWLAVAAPGALGLAGLALFLLPLRGVRIGSMNGLGLISVLPVASLAGLALQVLAFAAMLARSRSAPAMLGAMLVAITFCLNGVTGLVEPLPRFATSYQVYGFVDYISHAGHAAPGLTAYFSWPGFLALMAFAAKASGAHSLLPLMTWWPVIIDVLLLVPFLLLTRSLRTNWRARWFAALLFCLGNWVGQDYFSPQSINYLLYLAFLAILLTWFSGQRPAGVGSKASRRTPGERAAMQVGAPQRAILLLVLIGIFVSSVVSHQLTPFLMLAACAGLVIVGRCTPRGLPILLGVILIGYVSYATATYWSGHLSTVFGDFGRLGSTVSSSVGKRIIGTPVHQRADYSRVGLAGLMAALAVLGLLRRWHQGVSDRALLVLLLAPVSMAGLQSYGGEISLRIYLFALPAAAMLTASLFFPQAVADDAAAPAAGRSAAPAAACAVISGGVLAVILAGLFFVARYGNEAFEQIPPGEFAAMNYIYDHDRSGTPVLWLSRPSGINATPQMPWQFRDLSLVRFASKSAPRNPADTAGVVAYLRRLGRGAYLITTSTEATYLRQTASFQADWERNFREAMAGVPGIRLVLSNSDAAVYQAGPPSTTPRSHSNQDIEGTVTGSTIWTPVGLAVLVIALILLLARELIRECLPARRWLMRPLALACVPAVTLLLIAVVERFRVLS